MLLVDEEVFFNGGMEVFFAGATNELFPGTLQN